MTRINFRKRYIFKDENYPVIMSMEIENGCEQVTQMRICHICLEECVSLTDLQTHIAKDHDMKHPSSLYVKTETYRQLFPIADPKIRKVC